MKVIPLVNIKTEENIDDILPIKVRRIYDPDNNPTNYFTLFIKNPRNSKWEMYLLSNKFTVISTKSVIKDLYTPAYDKNVHILYGSGVVQVVMKKLNPILAKNKVDTPYLRNYLRHLYNVTPKSISETIELTILNSYNGSTGLIINKSYIMTIETQSGKTLVVPPIDIFIKCDNVKIRHSLKEGYNIAESHTIHSIHYEEITNKYKNVYVSNVEPMIIKTFGIKVYKDLVSPVNEGNMTVADLCILYSLYESDAGKRSYALARLAKNMSNLGLV